MCVWDLDVVKGYAVRARRNSDVFVEFYVKAGFDRICPGAPVILNVTFGALQDCPPDISARDYLPLRAAGAQRLWRETCGEVLGQGRTLAYALKVNSPANSRGKCTELQVDSSDYVRQFMMLRYMD